MIYRLTIFSMLLMLSSMSYAEENSDIKAVGPEENTEVYPVGDPTSPLELRLRNEREDAGKPFVITPYKPIYALPVYYHSDINNAPYKPFDQFDPNTSDLDNVESKFQISFKIPVIRNMFDGRVRLWFAYTQVAFWQVYNSSNSSPFRETDYEPEVMLDIAQNTKIFGLTLTHIIPAFVHQSNGRSDPLSRSWNRITSNFVFENDNFVLSLKPWYRIPEKKKDDNNPDIEKYLGYGDYIAAYKHGDQVYAMLLRNNFKSNNNRTSVELDWSVPVTEKIKLYLQYINGYGDGLINYDYREHTIGIGVALTDWM